MPLVALVCAGLLVGADAPAAAPDVAAEYRQVEAAAGRSPEAQVRLALWCEAHSLPAGRARHLALAVLADPANAAARGLLGLVARQDRWVAPGAVADQVKADPALTAALAEYDRKRSATPYTADGQLQLGRWADERGLTEQARAHYTAVTRLDPARELAWKRLGYKRHDGRWVTDAELAAAKADAEAQKQADRRWAPLLERAKADLGRPSKRQEAEAALLAVTDPRAVASIARAFAADGPRAVQLLGQVDSPAASRALAHLALAGPSAETRRAAVETLRRRDPREYAEPLINLIRDPIHYEVRPVNGPGMPGVLYVEGPKANVQRLYTPASLIQPGDQLRWDRASNSLVVDRVVGEFTTGKPNVTGHSSYWLEEAGYLDSNGNGSIQSANPIGSGLAWAVFSDTPAAPTSLATFGAMAAHASPAAAGRALEKMLAQPTASRPRIASANSPGTRAALANSGVIIPMPSDAMDARRLATYSAEQLRVEQQRSIDQASKQLQADVASLEQVNKQIRDQSDRAIGILTQATGQDPGSTKLAWSRWWIDQLGFAIIGSQTQNNPTFVEDVPIAYQPQANPINMTTQFATYRRASCFGAGTLVQTLTGPRPIEAIEVGDLVLTQSTATGGLGYHPVTVTHHNPPAPTFRVELGDDTVVASHFHRFWVAGRGWVMARDLKAGDPIRTLGGVRPVGSVAAGQVELVYNLDVADDASFFAGASAALVHDNTLPDPRLVPFDRPLADPKAVAAR